MRSKTDFYRLFFEQLARKGFDVKRSQSSDYIADIYYKNQLVAYFTDPVSNAIVADALLEQELVTDPKAAARLEAIRQLDDVSYDTGFEPPISDLELDGLDLER